MFDSTLFTDKHIFITGVARGIGRCIAEKFCQHGATLTGLYHQSEAQAQELAEQAEREDWKLTLVQGDIRDPQQCQALIETAVHRADGIDILINNSGVMHYDLLLLAKPNNLDDMINTNVKGTLSMCQAVIPHMMRQRNGNIINISSICDSLGSQGQVQYAATKGGVTAMSKALAVEIATKNIRVNVISPGVIETDMSKAIRDLAPDEVYDRLLIKRFGQVEDVAHAALFLASPYADYITGQVLRVDGGFKMR